jgi:spore germination cell wall hydrolase CwlJ-like protein
MTNLARLATLVATGLIVATVLVLVTQHKFNRLEARRMADPVQYSSVKDLDRQLRCMAQNIYWEAAGEPPEGKLAVGQIVLNRVAHEDFPKDPCQVIFQRNVVYSRVVCQFSWYCENNYRTRAMNPESYRESMEAAKMVLLEGFRLPALENALYYHADYVNPQWRKERVAKIGRHIFYRERQI